MYLYMRKIGILAMIVLVTLSACSIVRPAPAPAQPVDVTQAPAAEGQASQPAASDVSAAYTQAAETIVAELTRNAPAVAAAPATATEIPLPPTSTPLPTDTPLPSDTPQPSNTPEPTAPPTAPATATSTPMPEVNWRLVTTDDFSFGFWPKGDLDNAIYQYMMGGYSIQSKVADAIVWATRVDQYAGVRLEVKGMKTRGPLDGYYGLICNFANGSNYYFLGVGGDGWSGIGLHQPAKITWLMEGMDTSGAVHTGGGVNVLRADCLPGNLSLWANGALLASVKDTTLSAGAVGMGIGSRQVTGVEALFDDLLIYQPEPAKP